MPTEARLLKMSVFAARSGVPVPTIKHYLRERLLPEPVRTSRNMAYYDVALVRRVRAIKHLQDTRHLPLRVIREVLERIDDDALSSDLALEASIAHVLGELAPKDTIGRAELIARGFGERELAFFVSLGVVTPTREGKQERFVGDDAALLRLLLDARRSGLSPQMLPPAIVQSYVKALQELVRVELEMFRAGVVPRAGEDLTRLAEIATSLSERLVVLLRRKLLLPTLRGLVERDAPGRTRSASKRSKRKDGKHA